MNHSVYLPVSDYLNVYLYIQVLIISQLLFQRSYFGTMSHLLQLLLKTIFFLIEKKMVPNKNKKKRVFVDGLDSESLFSLNILNSVVNKKHFY